MGGRGKAANVYTSAKDLSSYPRSGADGILEPCDSVVADFGVRIWNPDGSIAEKSGNGLRIFAHWLHYHQGAPKRFRIDTGACIVQAHILDSTFRLIWVCILGFFRHSNGGRGVEHRACFWMSKALFYMRLVWEIHIVFHFLMRIRIWTHCHGRGGEKSWSVILVFQTEPMYSLPR